MNGGDAIVAALQSRGIEAVFFVPGGTYVTVLKALSTVGNSIRAVPTRLESSAAFAADAYFVAKRKPACIFVSRAPGATNAAIGIHTAMQGSRPMVLFIANIPKRLQGREAFQEIDYRLMYAPIAKAVFEVHSIAEVADVTARAVDLSVSGRPGPVVVVVSKDILDAEADDVRIPKAPALPVAGPDPAAVSAAAELIRNARRPVIIAGEIAASEGAGAELAEFADATGAVVMSAYRQQDVIDNEHPSHVGHLSLNRLPFQEEALRECDVIVAVGTRLDSVTSNDYALPRPEQKLLMIYPAAGEFSQWQADVAIAANVRPTLKALSRELGGSAPKERIEWRDALHAKEVAFAQPGEIQVKGDVDMAKVIKVFNDKVPGDCIISIDAGTFGRWISRYYRYRVPGTNAAPVSGAMGYGVPGAIGAQVAAPERMVFCWVGDGGFTMTGHEVATAVQENLPVKFIVCDNAAWGSILVHQQKRYGDWDFGTRLVSPDFTALGKGYGIPSFSVKRTEEFAGAMDEAMAHPGPALIHLHLDLRDVSPFTGSAR